MPFRRKEVFGGTFKQLADDVYGQPGHPVWIKQASVIPTKISINQEIQMPTGAEIKSRLLKSCYGPIARQVVLLGNSCTLDSIANALRIEKGENSMTPKRIGLSLGELEKSKMIKKTKQKLPEGKEFEYWSLTHEALVVAVELWGVNAKFS